METESRKEDEKAYEMVSLNQIVSYGDVLRGGKNQCSNSISDDSI